MPACRKAHNGKALFVEAILVGTVVQKGDSAIAVLYLSWKNGLGAEPVVDRSQGKTTADYFGYGLFHITYIGVFIVDQPTAAMYENHQWQFPFCMSRRIDVQQVFLQGIVVVIYVPVQNGAFRESIHDRVRL